MDIYESIWEGNGGVLARCDEWIYCMDDTQGQHLVACRDCPTSDTVFNAQIRSIYVIDNLHPLELESNDCRCWHYGSHQVGISSLCRRGRANTPQTLKSLCSTMAVKSTSTLATTNATSTSPSRARVTLSQAKSTNTSSKSELGNTSARQSKMFCI